MKRPSSAPLVLDDKRQKFNEQSALLTLPYQLLLYLAKMLPFKTLVQLATTHSCFQGIFSKITASLLSSHLQAINCVGGEILHQRQQQEINYLLQNKADILKYIDKKKNIALQFLSTTLAASEPLNPLRINLLEKPLKNILDFDIKKVKSPCEKQQDLTDKLNKKFNNFKDYLNNGINKFPNNNNPPSLYYGEILLNNINFMLTMTPLLVYLAQRSCNLSQMIPLQKPEHTTRNPSKISGSWLS